MKSVKKKNQWSSVNRWAQSYWSVAGWFSAPCFFLLLEFSFYYYWQSVNKFRPVGVCLLKLPWRPKTNTHLQRQEVFTWSSLQESRVQTTSENLDLQVCQLTCQQSRQDYSSCILSVSPGLMCPDEEQWWRSFLNYISHKPPVKQALQCCL